MRHKLKWWPLTVSFPDGNSYTYSNPRDYRSNPIAGVPLQNVRYRVWRTQTEGDHLGVKWMIDDKVPADMWSPKATTPARKKDTFICDFCDVEQPIRVWDDIEAAFIKNHIGVPLEGTYQSTRNRLAKKCLDCIRVDAKRIWGDDS
jgi:hypothetical protein